MNVALNPNKLVGDRLQKQISATMPDVRLLPWNSGDKAPAETVDVLLAMGTVTRADMESLPGLTLIQTLSDGYDAVDVKAATELGIWVSYAPAEITGNEDSVAEFAVLLLLATARRLGIGLAATHDASAKKPANAVSLLGKTVCIVGMGHIGTTLAQRLVTFGVQVIGVDRMPLTAPKQIPTTPLEKIDEALAQADFVVLCIRGTAENTHMFNAAKFEAMKSGAMLVNIARGSLVDEKALYEAVKSGHLGGAGLDVLENEPVDPANPLLTLPEVVITPHQAGVTDLTGEGTAEYVRYVLQEFKAGRKPRSFLNTPDKPKRPLPSK